MDLRSHQCLYLQMTHDLQYLVYYLKLARPIRCNIQNFLGYHDTTDPNRIFEHFYNALIARTRLKSRLEPKRNLKPRHPSRRIAPRLAPQNLFENPCHTNLNQPIIMQSCLHPKSLQCYINNQVQQQPSYGSHKIALQ